MTILLREYNRCAFCEERPGDSKRAYVYQGPYASAFLNPRQFGKGAALIIPNEHRETILDLTRDELAEIHAVAREIVASSVSELGAVGATIYQRNGDAAGQHVPHYHLHVVPRYRDDDPTKQTFLIPHPDDTPKTPYEDRRILADKLAKGIRMQ